MVANFMLVRRIAFVGIQTLKRATMSTNSPIAVATTSAIANEAVQESTSASLPPVVATAPFSSSPSSSSPPHPKTPISGLIGILKPSGRTSMSLLDALKPLLAHSKLFQVPVDESIKNKFRSIRKRKRRNGGNNDRFQDDFDGQENNNFMAPKLGQGGTLDPLADGVLVLGIGSGTKKLQQFLECTKEYKTIGLLGTSTLSYDSDDPILHRKPYNHVNSELIKDILPSFTGKIKQLPPLYSAIRIDGKRLFDYAREGLDLPRPIEGRDVEISRLELIDWKQGGEHDYKEPTKECDEAELKIAIRARRLAGLEAAEEEKEGAIATEDGEPAKEADGVDLVGEKDEKDVVKIEADSEGGEKETRASPPTFTLQMTVSSGTYVRSVVHDVGVRVKSAAHVVRLSRTRQGDWISGEYQVKAGEDESKLKKAIDWETLMQAAEETKAKQKRQKVEGGAVVHSDSQEADKDTEALSAFDQLLLNHMEVLST